MKKLLLLLFFAQFAIHNYDSDCFGKAVELPETQRGDLIAIRTAGAYGEIMASDYNLSDRAKAVYSDEL